MKRLIGLLIVLKICLLQGQQSNPFVYKEANGCILEMEVCYPSPEKAKTANPAILFIQGGGWATADRSVFYDESTFFSAQGFVTFLFDYRNRRDHRASPFDALEDCKSAIRYVRRNAKAWNIDPNKIYVIGVSAGGHMGMATALIDGFENTDEDLNISSRPNALALINPVLDNGPEGYAHGRLKERYLEFSPYYHVRSGAPPSMIIGGALDPLAKVDMLQRFEQKMTKAGNRCELMIIPNESHNLLATIEDELYRDLLLKIQAFLNSI